MAFKFDAAADINASKNDWCIVTRIIHLWTVSNCKKKTTRVTSIDMILCDKEGIRIHASVCQHFVNKFENVLKEGSVYQFKGFSVSASRVSIKPQNTIVRYISTQIPRLPYCLIIWSIPLHMFLLLIVRSWRVCMTPHVLGILTNVGEERSIDSSSGLTKLNVIEFENKGVKITCSLWGVFVDQLNTYIETSFAGTTIVALFSVKIKEFQNTIHSTKMVFNPKFPEAVELRGCLSSDTPYSQGVSRLTSSGMPCLVDDFLTLTEAKTIAQLMELTDDIVNWFFIVMGTIDHLVNPLDWWYLACKCHIVVHLDSAAYYCNFCGTRVMHPTARYRIKVNVVDESGPTTFVLFDRLASMLLNKDCACIINSSTEVDNSSSCPAIISTLVDKEFLFKVDVNDRTPKQFEKTYIVKRITNDNSIIEKFKYKNSIPSVSSTKVSVHAVSDALDPKDSSKTELDKSNVNDDVEFDGSAVNDDVEPLLLLTPLESVGNSKGKAAMDDLVYLKTTVSSTTHVASDVGEILHEKINPRPLKRIKIEKE
ncbi:hypothetical protein OROGR_030755 [Orobanche gracilis]